MAGPLCHARLDGNYDKKSNDKGWPEPYTYGEYTVLLAGKSPNIKFTLYIYIYTVLANPAIDVRTGIRFGSTICGAAAGPR